MIKFCGDFSLDDAPPSGRPGEVDSDKIKTLGTTSYHPIDSLKYPNQMLKIICTSMVMLTALMFSFYIS